MDCISVLTITIDSYSEFVLGSWKQTLRQSFGCKMFIKDREKEEVSLWYSSDEVLVNQA